jgi:putative hydrolase of the HAD superfamily
VALAASRRAYRQAIAQNAQKQQRDRLCPFETRREKVEHALASLGKPNPMLATAMVRAFEQLREEHRQLTPDAQATLHLLQDRGLRLALISNGNATYQRRKIAQHHLAPFFQGIFLEEEYGKAKPDPLMFLAALEHLQLAAQETWMIGDNLQTDIAGAESLGILTLWYTPIPAPLAPDGSPSPDRCISSLGEIMDLLQEVDTSS